MSHIESRPSLVRVTNQAHYTNSQLAMDASVGSFSSEASNPLTLIPMASASFAFQLSRSGLLAMGAGRVLSSVLALGFESSALRGSSCFLSHLSGSNPEDFLDGKAFLRTSLDLGIFKLVGHLLPSTHFVTRHSTQAFAMLGAEDLASSVGLLEHNSANISSRFAHALASSVQMEVGALMTGIASGNQLRVVERSLETSAQMRSARSISSASASQQESLPSMAAVDILTDARNIPLDIRASYKRFVQGVEGLRRYVDHAHFPSRSEPATQGEVLWKHDDVPRDSQIPLAPVENHARIEFVTRFLGFARGRGSQFAIDQAENAVSFFNAPNPEVARMGALQILAISEDTIRDFENPSVERPYLLPTPPSEMIQTVGHVVQLAPDHPGFKDPEYRARRDIIARIARDYAPDTLSADHDYSNVPEAPYVQAEHDFWAEINRLLAPLHEKYACREYLEARRRLEVTTDRIPQLRDLNRQLRALTGFQMVPVEGLVTTEAFIGTLAKRIFLSTQYVRHHSRPGYTPEPDVSHEITGHAAFLSNPHIAELSRLFGEAILRAKNSEQVTRLGNLYWHTIEYGVLMEDGAPKAYGAGHFGSSGELPEVAVRRLLPFNLPLMERTPYDPTRMQPFYFAAPSFAEMVRSLREHLQRWPG